MSIQGQGHLLTLAKGHLHIKFQTEFSQKHFTNQNQILYVVSLGRGNQSLYKWSRSHDQDGRHAHICGKIL